MGVVVEDGAREEAWWRRDMVRSERESKHDDEPRILVNASVIRPIWWWVVVVVVVFGGGVWW